MTHNLFGTKEDKITLGFTLEFTTLIIQFFSIQNNDEVWLPTQ
jgi:hypothetical protein